MKTGLILLTVISSLLLPLALPNEFFLNGNPLLGFFCLSFFFLACYRAPSFKFASLIGVIFGGISFVLANYWLKNFNEFAVWTLGGSTVASIGYHALLAPVIHGFSRIKSHSASRALVTAAVYCVYEFLRSYGYLGYPWGLIAYPVHTVLPFVQFVDITGLWGLSFLMSLWNSVIAEIIDTQFPSRNRQGKNIVWSGCRGIALKYVVFFVLSLSALAFIYGAIRLRAGFSVKANFTALLVQQNSDPWDRGKHISSIRLAQKLTHEGIGTSLHEKKKYPDLIIWNESAFRYSIDPAEKNPIRDNPFFKRHFPEMFKGFGTYTLTGAPVRVRGYGHFNGAILISKDEQIVKYYGKQHPVPFVENIPFWNVKFVRDFFEKVVHISSMWVLGLEYTVFSLPIENGKTVTFGVPICFEDVFPDLCRRFIRNGADFLVNITNDSWSNMKSALVQHIAAARFRAIENRRTLVRGTNAGLTCIIEAGGEIASQIPMFRADYLLTDIPVYREKIPTLYTLFGDYFAILMIIILFYILIEDRCGFSIWRKILLRIYFTFKKLSLKKDIIF